MKAFNLTPVAVVHSPYKEKFGIPRQPQLAPDVEASVELVAPFSRPEALSGLAQASHIWLQFIFHQTIDKGWKPTVRPPRLGGNKRLGVFATRATHRPNALGLSVVKLLRVEQTPVPRLIISGCDLLDGTPVLDIKPYIPYVDSVAEATHAFAEAEPQKIAVHISPPASQQCEEFYREKGIDLTELLGQILSQDPKPAYQTFDAERVYGMRLFDKNIQWQYQLTDGQWLINVTAITAQDLSA
ncbi:tRNA (adenine(37)-N6)-methyltransferase [Sinobacterium norvegicum]|uniref:tRNA (Adenine(37)-N6)-methyltransferase n=1 Tax=Sinobacterium norvegicum TaxID=1641715 RepID=A0ABM9AGP9_9GAMM|nr:tRNA (N6-threonylcarbamoyladenosine(37)-N6)-methyltransferase TrmO [Sinobacterium norvegicum]CAH0992390.1 tRNA (adenine(37)-N6)-methyltransferase [Sinobacterium norvegicum]